MSEGHMSEVKTSKREGEREQPNYTQTRDERCVSGSWPKRSRDPMPLEKES
jgi:hypothetical protein